MSLKSLFSAKDMTLGSPWKRILEFSIPMLLGNIAQHKYLFAILTDTPELIDLAGRMMRILDLGHDYLHRRLQAQQGQKDHSGRNLQGAGRR